MMKNRFSVYYLCSVLSVVVASFYPLYMGVSVFWDMLGDGVVRGEDYPKYLIPYTPISLSLIVGVLMMPLLLKLPKRFSYPAASGISVAVFFGAELLLENAVIVSERGYALLENWQMYMCYVPYEEIQRPAIDVLIGDYHPAFKLHFYMISLLLILAFLKCFYGFGQMILSGDRSGKRRLILLSAASVCFLGMCIWACFTAFYRTGTLLVSSLSAVLMVVFFVLMGVTAGICVGTFLIRKHGSVSFGVSALVSVGVTLLMYLGEMILLGGNLYRFGQSWFFEGIGGIVLAPADLGVLALSGLACFLLLWCVERKGRFRRR